ncbi:hypothetical protein N480_22815 [Pseudoalteromonas luteoviolacea S2607]|uniref:DUF4097 family beta strand repeat-containing protein n=1 Tax=Pseudoalteromonas luteoviolacea TaxID=43657 RepID=UPI0007B04CCD|nr:DUF4097 family beta strand repeat-containing protein [Pseudoalteromonas luteoviolacea]KZN34026.1 hypothetical protein N480_22815 [Pseudoalteromonas luteoviolacea S2607]
MTMLKTLSPLLCTLLLGGCIVHVDSNAQEPHMELTRSLTLPVENLNQLNIDNGAGDIVVTGAPNIDEIEVTANIITFEDRSYTFTLERSGNQANLVAKHNPHIGVLWYANKSPRIDIEVRLPARLLVEVEDSSGAMAIANVKGVVIDDSSGHITLNDIQGNAEIKDDSGGIEIDGVAGHLRIDDNSGDINLSAVTGNIDIEDGSGDINITSGAKVTIDDDSGDIMIKQIAGEIELQDGSGEIRIDGALALNVRDDSGDIDVKNIRNDVAIDDGSGSIWLSRVQGQVQIEDGSGDINVSDTKQLEIKSDSSGEVNISNVAKVKNVNLN